MNEKRSSKPSPLDSRLEELLTPKLRGTSPRLEQGFNELCARLPVQPSRQAAKPLASAGRRWAQVIVLAGSVAAAVILSLFIVRQSPAPADDLTHVPPEPVLDTLFALDEQLHPLLALLDTETRDAILYLPNE